MWKHLRRSILALAFASCGCFESSLPAYADDFELSDVITAIKQEIQSAQAAEHGDPRLKIDRVEIELSLVADFSGEAGLEFKVPDFGAQLAAGGRQRVTHSLTLVLVPSGQSEIGAGTDLGFVQAIQNVKEALRQAMRSPPSLKLDQFTFEVEFAVTQTAKGGFSFVIFDASASVENSVTHKLRIFLSLAT